MSDYVISAELELLIKDFQKNIDSAQDALKNFQKQAESVKTSTSQSINDKPFSSFAKKIESLGSKINKGTSSWGVDFGKFYDKGSGIFKSFGVDIDKFAGKFGMSGKLMSGIVACVSALVKLGQEMDEARKQIVLGTGAIGDALDELDLSAKKSLVNGVGVSVAQTGKLIADLNTRFGTTGKVLEDMTVDFGHFAKITGTDVNNVVNQMADVMARWNIPAEKSRDLMNQLAKAGQISGASMNELMSGINQGQVYLSQFGFNLTESISLLSSFRKNGVQTSSVIMGMRTALAKFSAEGKNAKQAFTEVSEQIRNAENDTEAMRIAVETFGQRSGPEMFKAIRSGSADVEDFTKQLREAGTAMEDTYEASRTSQDAMNDLKNAFKGTFGGIGQGFSALWKGILDGITEFVRFIEPIVTPIAETFRFVFSKIGQFISWFIKNLRECVQKNSVYWGAFISTLNKVGKLLRDIFGDIMGIFKDTFGLVFSLIGGKWEKAWLHAQLIFFRFGRVIANICTFISNLFIKLGNSLGKFFMNNFGGMIKQAFKSAVWVARTFHIDPTGIGKMTEGLTDENVDRLIEHMIFTYKDQDLLTENDFAESWGLNEKIAEAEKRLAELEGKSDEIRDLGEPDLSFGSYSLDGIDGSGDANKNSTVWLEKRLQQQLDAIETEKNAHLKALQEEGATQEELDKVNEVYAQKQIEKYNQIQELKKANDLKSIENVKNYEEEKLNLEQYYTDEGEKYRTQVMTNTVKAIEKVEEESTEWKAKLLEQEITQIENARNKSIELAEKEGRSIEEIQAMQRESINKQIAKYLELMNMRREADLENAKGEEEKANVEKYYANETTNYVNELWGTMYESLAESNESWFKKFKKVFSKVTEVVKKVFTKTVQVAQKIWGKMFEFMKLDKDSILDGVLEFADTIQTFFIETLPEMPGIMEGIAQTITTLIDTLTQPEVLNNIIDGVTKMIVTVIQLIANNIGKILKGIGQLIGAIIRAIGQALTQIDWVDVFVEVVGALGSAILEIFSGIWDALVNIFSSIGQWIAEWWTNLWNNIGKWFSDWWNNLWGGVTSTFDKKNNSTGSHIAKGVLGVLTGGISWLFTGFATGTNNADSGLHLVGEQGPELIDMKGGERVYNAENTRAILGNSSGGGNSFNVTFNNTTDTTAYTMMRQLKKYQRQMAMDGIL